MKKWFFAAIALALNSFPVNAQVQLQQFPFPGAALGNADGNLLNRMVNAINNLQGTGSSTTTPSIINKNNTTGTTSTALTGTDLQVLGANATVARIEIDAFGAVPFTSVSRRNGTLASPTAILSADQLGGFNFHGASTTALIYGPAASYRAYATENWSSTAGGTKLVLSTTPNTTQTLTDAVTIGQDQSLTVVGATLVANGTVGAPSVAFASDADTGIYRIGANNIGIGVNGAKVLDVGTTGLGITGVVTSGAHAITSASANALVAGLAGATNPAFNVDASTASSATGLQIKSAAAAGGLAVAVLSSGTDENLTINAKGAGTVSINATATGAITLARATTASSTLTAAGQLITTFGTPTIASGACGTTTNGVITSGTNQAGLVTIGAAATTTCTISFSTTITAPNACVVFPHDAGGAATGTTVARVSSVSTTNFVITGSALASTSYYYLCV